MSDLVAFRPAMLGPSFCIANHFFDIEKLIMMQKLEPRTVGLKPIELDMWTGSISPSESQPFLRFEPWLVTGDGIKNKYFCMRS